MNFDREQLWSYAEDYIKGALNADLTHHIMTAINNDEQLKDEWESHLKMLQTFNGIAQKQALKNKIIEARKDTITTKSTSKSFFPTFSPNVLKWSKNIAAILAIVITSSYATSQFLIKDTQNAQNNEFISLKRDIQHIKNSQEKLKETIDNKDQNNLPALDEQNITGTGFAISNDGYLVTDYHVIDKADSIYIKIKDSLYKKAFLVAFDQTNDIAILKIEDGKYKFTKTELPYHIYDKTSPVAQSIFSIGYPQDNIFYTEGYISSHSGVDGSLEQYQLELPANPGQSGSPIFDQSGDVIGMLLGKKVYATYAIKSSSIIELVASLPKEHKIKLTSKNNLKGLPRTEQVKRATEFVYPVLVFKNK